MQIKKIKRNLLFNLTLTFSPVVKNTTLILELPIQYCIRFVNFVYNEILCGNILTRVVIIYFYINAKQL